MKGQKAPKTCWISLFNAIQSPCLYRRCKANIEVPIKIKDMQGKRNFCVLELVGHYIYDLMKDRLMVVPEPEEEEEEEDQDGGSS